MRPTEPETTKKRFRFLVGSAVGLVALTWFFLAPTKLGGSVDYVVTDGNSMEPMLHEGDLGVIRHAEDYEVGDVAAYTSPQLGRIVLHRIDAIENGRFIFKGDNNSWLDSERLQAKDMVGKLEVSIPRLGGVIGTLGSPVPAALTALAVAGLIGFVTDRKRRRDEDELDLVAADRGGLLSISNLVAVARPIMKGAAVAIVLLGAVVVSAFTRSTTIGSTVDTPYEHNGRFSYSAPTEKGSAIAGAALGNGTPIFFSLSDRMNVSFRYAFAADAPFEVAGRGRLVTHLQSDTGWTDRIASTRWSSLDQGRGELSTTVDLAWLQDAVRRLRAETGVATGGYRVTFSPEIHTSGEVRGSVVDDRFSPDLSFQVDDAQLLPLGASVDQPLAALVAKEARTAEVGVTQAASLHFLRFEVPVSIARLVGVTGVVLALAVFAFFGFVYRRALTGDEELRIMALYGDMIVDIEPGQIEGGLNVPTFDALLRAAGPEALILHTEEADGDWYWVLDQQPFRYRALKSSEALRDEPGPEMPFEAFPQLRPVVFVEELGMAPTA